MTVLIKDGPTSTQHVLVYVWNTFVDANDCPKGRLEIEQQHVFTLCLAHSMVVLRDRSTSTTHVLTLCLGHAFTSMTVLKEGSQSNHENELILCSGHSLT